MILGAMAWYIVMAEVVNETLKQQVFTLFPFKKPLAGASTAGPAIPS